MVKKKKDEDSKVLSSLGTILQAGNKRHQKNLEPWSWEGSWRPPDFKIKKIKGQKELADSHTSATVSGAEPRTPSHWFRPSWSTRAVSDTRAQHLRIAAPWPPFSYFTVRKRITTTLLSLIQ